MDKSEFPNLGDSTTPNQVDKTLSSSWAEIAQPHPDPSETKETTEPKLNKPELDESHSWAEVAQPHPEQQQQQEENKSNKPQLVDESHSWAEIAQPHHHEQPQEQKPKLDESHSWAEIAQPHPEQDQKVVDKSQLVDPSHSWAEVAQPHPEKTETDMNEEPKVNKPHLDQDASWADIAHPHPEHEEPKTTTRSIPVSSKKEVAPEPKKEVAPEPKKEVTPEPKKEATPEPKKEATPEPKKEPTPEPKKEPTPEPKKEVTPEPKKQPTTPEPKKEEATPEPKKAVAPEPREPKLNQFAEDLTRKVDHRPGVWETQKQNASFADIAGHEKKQSEEFPTPQESLSKLDTSPIPTSGGVSDLLHQQQQHTETKDTTLPPNPDRSFAAVTSNKDFPTPEHDTTHISNEPSLSQLPDVKDMLKKPSVHVPPVPPTQSFAKMAAKEIPPENRPLSERSQYILSHQPTDQEKPYVMTDENFPTLGQSNLMAEHHASTEEKEIYTEISKFNQLNEEREAQSKVDPSLKKSFADITSSNLDTAPPAAVPHVDQHPVYDERLVYEQNEKKEERKHMNVEHGNNEQLIKEEKEMDVTPEKLLEKELEEEGKVTEKSRPKNRGMGQATSEEDSLAVRLSTFDKGHTGVITIFDTILALYRLNYSWFSILPGAYLMHLRLSPMTSPYGFPFIYRSIFDLILLPIYTKNLSHALSYKTPMLSQNKEGVTKLVEKYGHESGSTKGLGYWDGLRAMRSLERNSLRWWQFGLWTIHRVQWTLTYTMLHEPKTNLVTTPTLVSLASG